MSKLKQVLQLNFIKFVEAVGEKLVDKVPNNIHKQRLDTCFSCDKFNFISKKCDVCGCIMRVKTWIPDEKCPVDKWGKYKTDSNEGNKQ